MTATIAFENLLEDGTVVASTEESGFEKENAYDHLTYDHYKPTAVPATLTLDAGKRPKGMWLADDTVETLTGVELVSDPDLDDSPAAWVDTDIGTGTSSVSGGTMTLASDAPWSGNRGQRTQTVATTIDAIYELTIINSHASGVGRVAVTGSDASTNQDVPANDATTFSFKASATSVGIIVTSPQSDGGTVTLTRITCRLADPDRTSNNNGLQVFGQLNKLAVAPGAGLVAYSGFGASDYLEQPYNAGLNPATGATAIPVWLKMSANTAIETVIERDSSTTAQRITAEVTAAGLLSLTFDDDTTVRTATTTLVIDDDEWRLYFFYYDTSGNVRIYMNRGQLIAEATGTALLTMTNTAAVFRVGLNVQGANPLTNGSVTLLDYRLSNPTVADMAAIYDSERWRFVINGTAPSNYLASRFATADYFAIAAHDGYTNSSTFELEYSDDNSTWVSLGTIRPYDDGPQMIVFDSTSHDYWRVTEDGAISSLGHVSFGRRLDLPLAQGSGYQALDESLDTKKTVTISATGQTLGSTIERNGLSGNINVRNMTDAWRREHWKSLAGHLDSGKLFFFCNDIENRLDETVLCWLPGKVPTPAYTGNLRLAATLSVKGHNQ